MKIKYKEILQKNMINVLKDVLKEFSKNIRMNGHHLYITLDTTNKKLIIPNWLKKKYSKEITIVIQHEYWNLKIYKEKFNVMLSFNDIKINLSIPFNSVISFTDPYANFGLKIKAQELEVSKIKNEKLNKKNNVIDFSKFKKLN